MSFDFVSLLQEKYMKKQLLIALCSLFLVTTANAENDKSLDSDKKESDTSTSANPDNRESSWLDRFVDTIVDSALQNPDFGMDPGVRN